MGFPTLVLIGGFMLGSLASPACAWDYEGHRAVNQLALAALPVDFPAFVRAPAAAERIAFLAGEPDRWRNTPDLPVKHCCSLDHYLDYEQLAMAGMKDTDVPPMRYVFATRFAASRAAHASQFPPIAEEHNGARTLEWPGFVPWAIAENYGKLKSAFSYLKVYQMLGTPEEVSNAEANILYLMGTMGHYVGDCSQPLHLTIHHNGWVGDNPEQYTRWPGFHAWIDGGFIDKAGIKTADMIGRIDPATALKLMPASGDRDPMFSAVLDYLKAQHAFVGPLYALEKNGAFKADAPTISPEGRKFIEERLLAGSRMLASIWVTAWKEAGPDPYLEKRLLKRSDTGKPAGP